ncbi:MAG: hypothetical protein COB04_10280 [Gammaproteobacteria bacterium]|nr:MAG: hypothetical protein COB04_10280 [Gammaproteobacteria bacterium]
MKNFNLFLLASFISFCSLYSVSVNAGPPDVYVVYLADDKALGKSIVSALPKQYKVKKYNATILLISDYSGKQKTALRLSKAKVVVFVNGKHTPTKLLDPKDFNNLVSVKSNQVGEIDRIVAGLSNAN